MKKLIVVAYPLGRSGSSALMGLLKKMGVFLGKETELVGPHKMNPKGFFELRSLEVFLRAAFEEVYPRVSLQTPEIAYLDRKANEFLSDFEAVLKENFGDEELCAVKSQRMLLIPLLERLRDVEVKVIMLSRNHEDQVRSIGKVWKDLGFVNQNEAFIDEYLTSWKEYSKTIQNHYPLDYLDLRFEDIVSRPLEVAHDLKKFIGLNHLDQGMLEAMIKDWIDPNLVNRQSNDDIDSLVGGKGTLSSLSSLKNAYWRCKHIVLRWFR